MDNIIKIFLGMILAIFLYSLIDRMPQVDDAWLGEHAYWQSKLGYVKSELMHGITQQEVYLVCHHKLMTLQGALFINVLGFSVYSLKLVSFCYFVIFLLLFYLFTYKKIFTGNQFLLALLLIVSNALIFEYSFVFRPEIPLMTLGFLSYMFLSRVLNDDSRKYLFTILSGFFAGLCVSTHLNGVMFVIAGFVLLAWNRKFVMSIVFGVSSIPAILVYFYDFTPVFNFRYWLYQVNESPMIDKVSDSYSGVNILSRLFDEHQRFFHSPTEISLALLLIVSLIISFRYLSAYKNLIRYTILLVVLLSVLSVHKTTKYMIPYLPYLMILITLSLSCIYDRSNSGKIILKGFNMNKAKPFLILLLLFYLIINTAKDVHLASDKWDTGFNRNIAETYIGENPEECRIIAPMTFIFNEIDHFKSIQGDLMYGDLQNHDKAIFKKGFLDRTRSYGIDYIILSGGHIHKLGMDEISDKELSEYHYQVLHRSASLLILKDLGSPKDSAVKK